MVKFISLVGLLLFLLIAFLLSSDKKKIDWKLVITGIIMQFVFALLILKLPLGQKIFGALSHYVSSLMNFTLQGSTFLFGNLLNTKSFGFIFAFQVLPTVIFFSALMNVLYYLGIMQKVVSIIAKVIEKLLKISGAESLCTAANIFLGQTEAPLVIKPYMKNLTNSELLTVMLGGMATVSAGSVAAYVSMGIDAGHLMAASIMSAPAAIVIAKILLPETETPETMGGAKIETEKTDSNVIDAAAKGTSQGLSLALNIGAMLLTFIALIALLNAILAKVFGIVGLGYINLQWILGKLFSPIAFLMGIPLKDISNAGNLLGQQVVINEFFAYTSMSTMIKSHLLSERTVIILTYALCGFANLCSIGIQIAGLGGLAEGKRSRIAELGWKALIGGLLASFMTATIAGILL